MHCLHIMGCKVIQVKKHFKSKNYVSQPIVVVLIFSFKVTLNLFLLKCSSSTICNHFLKYISILNQNINIKTFYDGHIYTQQVLNDTCSSLFNDETARRALNTPQNGPTFSRQVVFNSSVSVTTNHCKHILPSLHVFLLCACR